MKSFKNPFLISLIVFCCFYLYLTSELMRNAVVLVVIGVLIFTSKKQRAVGYLVATYYAVYMLIDIGEHSGLIGNVTRGLDSNLVWYLMCAALSSIFSVWASYLYISRGGAICLYAVWLIFDAIICSILALSQVLETNRLVLMYNAVQSVNLYIDIAIVIVGTDNIIKRSSKSAALFINYVNASADRWIDMVFNPGIRGAEKCKKNSTH